MKVPKLIDIAEFILAWLAIIMGFWTAYQLLTTHCG